MIFQPVNKKRVKYGKYKSNTFKNVQNNEKTRSKRVSLCLTL